MVRCAVVLALLLLSGSARAAERTGVPEPADETRDDLGPLNTVTRLVSGIDCIKAGQGSDEHPDEKAG